MFKLFAKFVKVLKEAYRILI